MKTLSRPTADANVYPLRSEPNSDNSSDMFYDNTNRVGDAARSDSQCSSAPNSFVFFSLTLQDTIEMLFI